MMFIEIAPGLFAKPSEMDESTLRKDLAAELQTVARIKAEMARASGEALTNKITELGECYGRVVTIEKKLDAFKQMAAIRRDKSGV